MAKATARHILVASEAKCLELKAAIEAGADFAQVAKDNSTCPSGRQGGDLGSFGPGQMVREFDTVVFSAPLCPTCGLPAASAAVLKFKKAMKAQYGKGVCPQHGASDTLSTRLKAIFSRALKFGRN